VTQSGETQSGETQSGETQRGENRGSVTKVGVIGARGAMGRLACAAVRDADGLELSAEIGRGDPLQSLQGCQVAVDLTHPGVVMDHIGWCIEHGVHAVVGTSGFSEQRLDEVRALLGTDPGVSVLVVPNFSIGAVLMMRFAAEAAGLFESVEIVEMHHPDKRDAPSGTALRTAQLVAEARRRAGRAPSPDATGEDELGARGARADDVAVHSLRIRGAVAHQEVLLGNPGELLSLRHDMLDRAAAMPGLLACVRAAPTARGLVVGLDEILVRR
jgi:4-hydroxy-tetrahydrodipicolinate reductase